MHHKSIAKLFGLSLDPFLVFKTFYFINRGFHVRTTRKQHNLRIIVKSFEVACSETAWWEKKPKLGYFEK